jgi:hypothetical protein
MEVSSRIAGSWAVELLLDCRLPRFEIVEGRCRPGGRMPSATVSISPSSFRLTSASSHSLAVRTAISLLRSRLDPLVEGGDEFLHQLGRY